MTLHCIECDSEFESPGIRGYCDNCIQSYRNMRQKIHASQHPAPGVLADGAFADPKKCPLTITDPIRECQVCGLCGSDNVHPGYGLGSGYGLGGYHFCTDCGSFLDFVEDVE